MAPVPKLMRAPPFRRDRNRSIRDTEASLNSPDCRLGKAGPPAGALSFPRDPVGGACEPQD